MHKLLIVDDEPNICFSVEQVFESDGLTVLSAHDAATGLAIAAENCPDVILLDVRLGNTSGLDVFRNFRALDPKCLVIFITGHGTTETAIEAMKRGAYDYLLKPLDAVRLREVVEQALAIRKLMHVPAIADASHVESNADHLIGSSPSMQDICKKIGRLAPQDVNVLILGESGTGKELVARAIYHHSGRSGAPMVAINCAAIPESLLESELFGHERGAFTGADRRRIGKFEQCDGGTLLLDEVGDMSPHTQAKILRLLQEGCLERVGGNESIPANVRIIAATNQDLPMLIEQGRFRKDLYYRLRGSTLLLPPLRERKADIPELAHHFLFRHNRVLESSVQSISQEAMRLLCAYDWPGNVRELQSVVREAMIISAGPAILPEFLPTELRCRSACHLPSSTPVASSGDLSWDTLPSAIETHIKSGQTDLYRIAREYFDQLLLTRVLRETEGNQKRAAEVLGLSRITLRERLRGMHISIDAVVSAPSEES